MELSRLTIRDFRNLASLDLELPPAGVVILGDNGQGKTNLLEALYYLVLFRSLRGAKDRELVRFGEVGFFVGGEVAKRNGGDTVSSRITAFLPTALPTRRPRASFTRLFSPDVAYVFSKNLLASP